MHWGGGKEFLTYFLDIKKENCRFEVETNKTVTVIYDGVYSFHMNTISFGTSEKNYSWRVVDSLVIKTDIVLENKAGKKTIHLYRIEQRDSMGRKLYERCVHSWAVNNGEPGKYEVVYYDPNDPCGTIQSTHFITSYKHGKEIVYRRNAPVCGTPIQKGEYKYGSKHGKWYHYCPNGRAERIEIYKKGILKKTKTKRCGN